MALLVTSALPLPGWSASRIVELSAQNLEAVALGDLTAYIDGRTIWLKLKDGRVLRGQFEVKPGSSFGELGKSRGIDRPGGAYTSSGDLIVHGKPTFIDMTGPGGATVHCEVMHDSAINSGSGVCLFSNGAEYRVLY
ncbi:hypothetical protein [Phenylobacterium sp.]|uniref:hypothetical protein n=1 Tax=Phenylobacterium sp. TaxID=1871053 RepID=UPI002F425632